jgi:6-phosphogluconolactonase
MFCSHFRSLLPIAVALLLGVFAPRGSAAEWTVFISAFAAGEEGAIHAFRLDQQQEGTLEPLHRTADVEHPFFLALSPSGQHLYSIHAPGQFGGQTNEQVTAFEVIGTSGKLKLLNRQSARGTAACYLDVDAGKTVLVANYLTGSVAALPVRDDGSLGEAATFVQHAGSSVDSTRQEGPHAHCIVISPDNRFAFAADLGLDKVLAYRLDGGAARISANRQAFVRTPPAAGPRHLTFHPNGRHVYVINELANSVTMFDYDAESGMLIEQQTISTLPDDFEGKSYCADLKITPNGRFLYGTNRGHDSIAAYRLADDGRLTLISIAPSLGSGPQNLAITPDGTRLLCANMGGDNVALFRIHPQDGTLQSVGQPVSMPKPSCIMLQ